MIFDLNTLFSNQQAVTATALSTNVVDLGTKGIPYGANALNKDVGKGTPMPILIQVTEAFNTLTSLTVTLEVASDAAMTTAVKVINTQTILLADLVPGKQTFMQYVPNGADERYMAVRYTVTGSNPSTGKFMAGITMGNQTNVTGA